MSHESAAPLNAPATFAELGEWRARIRECGLHRTVDGAKADELLEITEALQRVHDWAAEMQLGAEGFDNTVPAALYSDVQRHLRAAAQDLARACATLLDR